MKTVILLSAMLIVWVGVSNVFAAENKAEHVLLEVSKHGDEFRIDKSVVVSTELPKRRSANRFYPWRYSVQSRDGRTLFERGMEDPTQLRGEFHSWISSSTIDGTHIEKTEDVSFSVRVPNLEICDSSTCRIVFHALKPGVVRTTNITDDMLMPVGTVRFQVNVANHSTYEVETLQQSGDSGNRVDIVILGDGYRSQDQQKLTDDANAFLEGFWSVTPYKEYRNYFNIKLVHVVSNQDGADGGMYGASSKRDTALGAYYYCFDVEHLLCVVNGLAISTATLAVPEFDNILVMVNDTKYGGSGGDVAVFSVAASAIEIVNHEFAHSFAGLTDEYDTPYPGFPDCKIDCPEPNASLHTIFEDIKWNMWIDPETPLMTPETATYDNIVGAFEGCRYQYTGVYRPWQSCKMNILGREFCPICKEAVVLGAYDVVAPIDGASPDSSAVILPDDKNLNLTVHTPNPDPYAMSFSWQIDGIDVAGSDNTYEVSAFDFDHGSYEITATVRDTTSLVRNDPQGLLTGSRSWTIIVGDGVVETDAGDYFDGGVDTDGDSETDDYEDSDSGEDSDDDSESDSSPTDTDLNGGDDSGCGCRQVGDVGRRMRSPYSRVFYSLLFV